MVFLTLFFSLLTQNIYGYDVGSPILVELSTDDHLTPISLSPIESKNSEFSHGYLKELDKVLQFDLSQNGKTAIISNLSKSAFEIKPYIHEKILGTTLTYLKEGKAKKIDGLPLTGQLNEDRKQIHSLADIIHKTIFGVEGIASTRILYTVKFRGKNFSEVFEADYDGANAKQITHQKALCVTPCYVPPSPGHLSRSFAFVSYEIGQPKIYFGSLDDGKMIRFSLLKGNQLMPTISQKRDKVAFISDITGNPDLFVQSINMEKGSKGKPRQIFSAHQAVQGTPTFSPDGEKIAFVSNKDGSARIYLMRIPPEGVKPKKGDAKLLTKQNSENTAPCWSPDGKKIAYCAKTKGTRQIWIYDLEKNQEWQLTDGPMNKENPTFAPNSLHLIYNASTNDSSDLYLINLNQKEPVKISSGPHEKRFPSWEYRF